MNTEIKMESIECQLAVTQLKLNRIFDWIRNKFGEDLSILLSGSNYINQTSDTNVYSSKVSHSLSSSVTSSDIEDELQNQCHTENVSFGHKTPAQRDPLPQNIEEQEPEFETGREGNHQDFGLVDNKEEEINVDDLKLNIVIIEDMDSKEYIVTQQNRNSYSSVSPCIVSSYSITNMPVSTVTSTVASCGVTATKVRNLRKRHGVTSVVTPAGKTGSKIPTLRKGDAVASIITPCGNIIRKASNSPTTGTTLYDTRSSRRGYTMGVTSINGSRSTMISTTKDSNLNSTTTPKGHGKQEGTKGRLKRFWKCDYCTWVLPSSSSKIHHVKTKHPVERQLELVADNVHNTCPRCLQEFRSLSTFKWHMLSVHTNKFKRMPKRHGHNTLSN